MPGGQVDDAQPAHPHRQPLADIDAFVIGSAVTNRAAHAADGGGKVGRIARAGRLTLDESRDATHSIHPTETDAGC
jgi:hypothetical protein